MSEKTNLLEAITEEIKRCKELLVAYKKIGKPGLFAIVAINCEIAQAEKVRDNHDTVAMVVSLKKLRECS